MRTKRSEPEEWEIEPPVSMIDARGDVPSCLLLGALDACGRARVEDVEFASPAELGC